MEIITANNKKSIKMSKSEWKQLGKKAGWIKESQISENIIPVSEILGTSSGGKTAEQIDQEMHSKGYFLFREHYPFGKMLSYADKNKNKVYLLNGVWSTWQEVQEDLRKTWRPVRSDDVEWFTRNVQE